MYRVILSLLNVIEQINSPTHTTKLPKTDLLSMQTCLKLGQPELSYSAIAQWVEINYWRASNYEPRFPEFFRLPLEGRGRTTRLGVLVTSKAQKKKHEPIQLNTTRRFASSMTVSRTGSRGGGGHNEAHLQRSLDRKAQKDHSKSN